MAAKTKRDYLTIGEVVKRLRLRFPDLSISKVRYFEEEGLIKPRRTKGGYRKFSKADVQRLEIALNLQRKKFLPLEVIRRKLKALDRGQIPLELKELKKATRETEVLAPPVEEKEPLSEEEIPTATGLSEGEVKSLEEFSILQPKETKEGKVFESLDVELMNLASEFANFGMEPRHLRMYESLAEKEGALFQQILLPVTKQKDPESRQRVIDSLAELSKISEQFKRLLLQKALRKYFPNL